MLTTFPSLARGDYTVWIVLNFINFTIVKCAMSEYLSISTAAKPK